MPHLLYTLPFIHPRQLLNLYAQKQNLNYGQQITMFPIQNIRADNGVYAAQAFKESCNKRQQRSTYCAIGAHRQNGIAEHFIGTITERARTILLHAMAKWPTIITEEM